MRFQFKMKRALLILGLFVCLMFILYGKTTYKGNKPLAKTEVTEHRDEGQQQPSLTTEKPTKVITEKLVIKKKTTWNDYLDKDTKVIYLYSTFFFQRPWSWMVGKQTFEHFSSCDVYKNCLVTYDKSWLTKADGVLFHGRDIEMDYKKQYSPKQLKEARNQIANKQQKWIWLSHENPLKTYPYKNYSGIFNWLATFDRNSNIFIPYSSYVEVKTPFKVTRNYAREKTGLVAWAVSNCGLLRDKYALELQKYLSLTVYGLCRKHFKNQRNCAHFDKACIQELSTYKFYLAFENDFCHDYVTEKYWERISQNVVPVVMGANYEKGAAIPGSYIDASEFNSIKELADYLLHLDKNDDEYNKYFAYKGKYEFGNPSIYCPICAALHKQDPHDSSTLDLGEKFSYENNCGIYKDKAEKFRKQIENSKRV